MSGITIFLLEIAQCMVNYCGVITLLKCLGFSQALSWILEKIKMAFANLVGSILGKTNTSALSTTLGLGPQVISETGFLPPRISWQANEEYITYISICHNDLVDFFGDER